MYNILHHRILLSLITGCIVLLSGAWGVSDLHLLPALNGNQGVIAGIHQTATRQNTSFVHATVAMPHTQTHCPVGGDARAAVSAPLELGNHENIVYAYTTDSVAILRRYDVSTGKKTDIVRLHNTGIHDAQLSADGQFILFVSQVADHPAIQMVRMDGQGLQTLYCADDPYTSYVPAFIDNLLWSPDQQTAVFESANPLNPSWAPIVQILNLHYGTLRTFITPTSRAGYRLRTWNGNAQVYMTGYYTHDVAPPHDVYTLDTRDGTIKRVAEIEGYTWDMNLTPDGRSLVLSQCANDPQYYEPLGPSLISIQPASGGKLTVLYASHVHAVIQARIVSDRTLLFIIGGTFGISREDGLWSIGLDGSRLTHLTTLGTQLSALPALWSSISRKGSLYAIIGYGNIGAGGKRPIKIFYGSLSGGAARLIAVTRAGEDAEVVGWTML